MNMTKRLAVLLSAVLLTTFAKGLAAQPAYPDRAVTLVVPFTAGSGSDIIARIVGPRLAERWRQPVVETTSPAPAATSARRRWPGPRRTATRC